MFINVENGLSYELPALKKSKVIICDLRGYPTNNTDFITYLMTVRDTSNKWMQIPQMVNPDRNISQAISTKAGL